MRQLPQDIGAERSTLGALLIKPESLDIVRDTLNSTEDFYDLKHAAIYQAILSLADSGISADVQKVASKLIDMGSLSDAGGSPYLIDLIESVPHAAGVEHYSASVAKKALARRLIDRQEAALASLYGGVEPEQTIDSSISELIEMRPSGKNSAGPLDGFLDEALEDDKPRIFSGLHALDDIVSGFEAGAYIIVGARPSAGKTAWGISASLNMAESGTPVGFISAEMRGRKIARRLVCADMRISTIDFERQKGEAGVAKSVSRLKELPFYVDETAGASIDKVCSQVRMWHREHGIKAAFIDYLQLLTCDKDTEYDKVTQISRQLKYLANELDISLFVLAQLNRGNTQRQDKRPAMSDLRGSGAVEQDADVILMLHRDAYYTDGQDILDGKVKDDEAQILVEKNRDGRTGTAHVGWIGKCGVFSSGRPSASATYGI